MNYVEVSLALSQEMTVIRHFVLELLTKNMVPPPVIYIVGMYETEDR